jgi:molybdopterin converting factor small subunit
MDADSSPVRSPAMSAKVRVPTIFRTLTGGQNQVEVDGATVGDALAALDARWPGLLDRVCDPGPILRRHLNVFVDGERAGLATPLRPGSTLHVIPAVSGGSRRPG